MNKFKKAYIFRTLILALQFLWSFIPIFLLTNLNYFPVGTAFIEKYLIILFINFLVFLLIILIKKQDYLLQNLQFAMFLVFNLIYTKHLYFDNNVFYNQNSEQNFVANLIFILFCVYLVDKFYKKNKFLLVQLILFLTIFHIEILGIYVIFLYLKYEFKFSFSKYEFIVFKSIPIIVLILRFIFSLSKNFNILWYSLIRKPFSGSTRFYDMQWNLLNIKCNSGTTGGEYLFFGAYMECPDIYSPIYSLINVNLNLQLSTYLVYLVTSVLFIFGYLKLLLKHNEKKELIVLLFISPPLNFLMYQGNFDLLVFVALLMAYTFFIKKNYLKIAIFFLLALLEIHPILLLVGLLYLYFIEKNAVKFLYSLISIIIFIGVLFYDFQSNEFSNQYLSKQLGTSTYVNDIYSSFGLKLDLIFLSDVFNINIYFLIFVFSIFLYFISSELNKNKIYLEKDMLPLSIYFVGTLLLENPVYRLSIFLILFIYLFNDKFKRLNYFIIFSLFINPTPILEIQNSLEFYIMNAYVQFDVFINLLNESFLKFDLLFVLLNRLGLYALYGLLLKYLFELIVVKLKLSKK